MESPIKFTVGQSVVYPAHGVGTIEGIETVSVDGNSIELCAIYFPRNKMRVKLPMNKLSSSGLRSLSNKRLLKEVFTVMKGNAKVKRAMWSRRAQQYEAKINSGDPVSIAEVLRDLYKSKEQAEQSYSERQIYQAALERLASEVAAVEDIDEEQATQQIESVLSKKAA